MQIAFYRGRSRIFNRLVAWWTRGRYSHCELIFAHLNAGALCWSASYLDGGVRLKVIKLNPAHWDLITVPATSAQALGAEQWFKAHEGQPYDVKGVVGQVWRAAGDDQAAWFCSEAIGAALGLQEPWRFDPNSFYSAIQFLPRGLGHA